MTDELFKAKRMLDETNALWHQLLGTIYEEERRATQHAYREAVRQASERLIKALEAGV